MRRLIFTLLLLLADLSTAQSAKPDTLTRISAQIEQHAVIRAEFTQTKQMAALKRPLVTTGHLVFSRQHGVLWQIEHPYRMSYILGEDRIVEIAADGTRRERGLRDVPGLTQVGRIFRALLGANTPALREAFDTNLQGDPTHWEIRLKPREAQLAQFLGGLNLSGGRFVESIRIDEAGGDTTVIRFRNTTGAEAPNASELTLFGAPAKP